MTTSSSSSSHHQTKEISIPLYTPSYGEEEQIAVSRALSTGFLNEGQFVRAFEKKFAQYVGARYCLLVPSGQLALYMAVMQYKFLFGVVPANYGIFAANAVSMAGVKVLGTDVSESGSNIEGGGQQMTTPGALFIGIHANGRKGAVTDIEDCAQHIAHHTRGRVSCYSFHSTKLLTCAGIGGAICCDDKDMYEALCAFKDHGRPERALGRPVSDVHTRFGGNFKMAEVNAAFGLAQLEKLPRKLVTFKKLYRIYHDLLGEKVEWIDGDDPAWRVDCLVNRPDNVVVRLAADGIEAKRFYLPLHKQSRYIDLAEWYPNTELLYRRGIYLPSTPGLSEEEVQRVCDAVRAAIIVDS